MALAARSGLRTLSQLASRINVPVNTLYNAIDKYPRSSALEKLPRVLGVDPCQLYLPPKEVLAILPPPAGVQQVKNLDSIK